MSCAPVITRARDDGEMNPGTKAARRATYEKWSAIPVFVCGSLFLVGLVEFASDSGDTSTGQVLMLVAWIGFVIDLIASWALDDTPRTFPKRHWFAFLAVLVPIFRAFFVFYIFIRLARGRTRLQSKIQYYAAYLTILVITFGAVLVLSAERNYPGSNIKTYGEAVWWACVTVTTVGYGDYVPVSPTGRAIATLMLFNGVAIISVITATISSRFVSNPDRGELPVTLDALDDRLARIEAAIAALPGGSGIAVLPPGPGVDEPGSPRSQPGPPSTPAR